MLEGHRLLQATLVDDAPVSLSHFAAVTFPLDALWPDVTARAENGENHELARPCNGCPVGEGPTPVLTPFAARRSYGFATRLRTPCKRPLRLYPAGSSWIPLSRALSVGVGFYLPTGSETPFCLRYMSHSYRPSRECTIIRHTRNLSGAHSNCLRQFENAKAEPLLRSIRILQTFEHTRPTHIPDLTCFVRAHSPAIES